jgi:hypothetical protein
MTSVDPPKAWVTIETVVSEKPGSADDKSRSDEEKSRNDEEKSRSDEEKSRSDEEKDCMRGDENPANDKEEKGSTAKSKYNAVTYTLYSCKGTADCDAYWLYLHLSLSIRINWVGGFGRYNLNFI